MKRALLRLAAYALLTIAAMYAAQAMREAEARRARSPHLWPREMTYEAALRMVADGRDD